MAVRRKFFGGGAYGGAQQPQPPRQQAAQGIQQPMQPGQPGQGGGGGQSGGQMPQRRPVAPQGPQSAQPGTGMEQGQPGLMTPGNVQPFLEPGGGEQQQAAQQRPLSGGAQNMGQPSIMQGGGGQGQGQIDQATIMKLLQGAGLL